MENQGRKIYGQLLRYLRPYRGRLILSIIASLGVAATDATAARLVQPFIDRLMISREAGLVYLVPIFILGLALFKGASRYVQEYFIRTCGQLVMQDIRNEVQRHSMSLSMGYFSRTSTGALMSRVLNDVMVMQASVAEVVVAVMREGVTVIALTGVAFYGDWQLAAVAFIVLPLAAGPASAIGKKIKRYSRSGQGAMGSLTVVLEQGLSGIKVIKAFGSEQREVQKFQDENKIYYRFMRKVIKYDAISSPLMELLSALGVAAVVWFGLNRVIAGEMTQGEFASVVAAILFMYTPAKRLSKQYNKIQLAIGAAERVFELLAEKQEITEKPKAKELPRARGMVAFEQVSFSYDEEPVLRDFSLSAAPGEVIALVGPSGAGKSTVVGLLNRFYDPQTGVIRIDGEDIRDVTIASLKENLALVDQETFLFNDSIGNNIRYGRPQASDAEVLDAAEKAYAREFIEAQPDGFDAQIGDRGLRLSGGQRQRICIARAILRDAPILLLDEATSALDTESESMVQKALGNLMENRTTFVIAHRLSTIMHADRIVVMDGGRVVQSGKHGELLAEGGLYKKLYDMQFKA